VIFLCSAFLLKYKENKKGDCFVKILERDETNVQFFVWKRFFKESDLLILRNFRIFIRESF